MATTIRSIAAAVLLAQAAATAQDPTPSPFPATELVRRLGGTLDSLARLDRFSGVVVLAKSGRHQCTHPPLPGLRRGTYVAPEVSIPRPAAAPSNVTPAGSHDRLAR